MEKTQAKKDGWVISFIVQESDRGQEYSSTAWSWEHEQSGICSYCGFELPGNIYRAASQADRETDGAIPTESQNLAHRAVQKALIVDRSEALVNNLWQRVLPKPLFFTHPQAADSVWHKK